jgi:hypothetical protein
VKIPIDPTRGGGGLGAPVRDRLRADPEAAADPGQARAAGEGDILVAEGGSPNVGWEAPPSGPSSLDLRFRGDGTSLYEVGLALLQETEL